jgi:hypothetical protein
MIVDRTRRVRNRHTACADYITLVDSLLPVTYVGDYLP